MHANAATITMLYQALQAGNAEAMAPLYHPEATFRDPVFDLTGSDIGDMWRMFCAAGADLTVEFSNVAADDRWGTARWKASYTFPPTRRSVHNFIEAGFEFEDGQIVVHRDCFDLRAWARQATGVPGLLLGWTPWMQNRIRQSAADQLKRFQQRTDPTAT
ncbi:nuclear transport factor 2 family protein [soil metagenome]